MSAFHVFVISHTGERLCFTAIARSRLDAQICALDNLTEPPRLCRAAAVGRAA